GSLPSDIPSNPDNTYCDGGWAGFGDWLGTGTIAPRLRTFLPFAEARAFARSLNLRSIADWRALSTNGKLPRDIPVHPERAYRDDGWAGLRDWLGTDAKRTPKRTTG